MRGSLLWTATDNGLDPYERLAWAVVRQCVVDAKKKGADSEAAMYLSEWGFPPSVWQSNPAAQRRQRTKAA